MTDTKTGWWQRLGPRRRRLVSYSAVLVAFILFWEGYKLVWGRHQSDT